MLFPPVSSRSFGGGRPLKNAAGAIKVAFLALTNAQFNALNATPQLIVPAPSASLMIVPVQFTYFLNKTVAYGTFPTLTLRHRGIQAGFELATGLTLALGSAEKDGRLTTGFAMPFFDNFTSARYPGGKGVEITLSAVPVGGTTPDSKFSLAYYIAPVP